MVRKNEHASESTEWISIVRSRIRFGLCWCEIGYVSYARGVRYVSHSGSHIDIVCCNPEQMQWWSCAFFLMGRMKGALLQRRQRSCITWIALSQNIGRAMGVYRVQTLSKAPCAAFHRESGRSTDGVIDLMQSESGGDEH